MIIMVMKMNIQQSTLFDLIGSKLICPALVCKFFDLLTHSAMPCKHKGKVEGYTRMIVSWVHQMQRIPSFWFS